MAQGLSISGYLALSQNLKDAQPATAQVGNVNQSRKGADMDDRETRLKRLPRWAQQEIKTSETNAANAEKELQTILDSKNTNVQYEPYRGMCGSGKKNIYLPNDCQLLFSVDGGKLNIRIDRGRLYIMGEGDHMNVRPSSSNVVTIGFEEEK